MRSTRFLSAVFFMFSLTAGASPSASIDDLIAMERDQLDLLHKQARSEGGHVVLWAGGDAPNQMDWFKEAFEKRFPGVTLDVLVDLSKFHDLRIDAELASGTLTPDVAMLQTTFDFERWKARGVLMHYRPVGFHQQKRGYADPDGAWITAFNYAFVPTYSARLPDAARPSHYDDFLRPAFKGKLVLTWPHDDDAVLYVYDQLRRTYGDSYLRALAAQHPTFLRGTAVPAYIVGRQPDRVANLTGYFTRPADPSRHWQPTNAPMVIWNQRMAMFKAARHPASARLLLSYAGSAEFQSSYNGWRARDDVGTADGFPPVETISGVDVTAFTRWMADRAQVKRLRDYMTSLFGPVTGESPLRDLSLLAQIGLGAGDVVAPPEPEAPAY